MKKEILIVDDDPDYCELTRMRLEQAGYQVSQVENGTKAIDFLDKKLIPDLIILDMEMPDKNGLTTLININAKKAVYPGYKEKNIPVLVATGLHSNYVQQLVQEHKINGYLKKPYTAEELFLKVKEIVDPAN